MRPTRTNHAGLNTIRRLLYSASIEATLAAGTHVLCDRYSFSGIAFSVAKGLPYEWCRAPEVSLPAPDLTLFFDISPEVARMRGGYGEERYEKEELQARVRTVYRRIETEMQAADARKWATIDAGRGKDTIAAEVWALVGPLLNGPDGPVARLWAE